MTSDMSTEQVRQKIDEITLFEAKLALRYLLGYCGTKTLEQALE